MTLHRLAYSRRARAAGIALAVGMLQSACSGAPAAPAPPPLFERLAPEATGLRFVNALPESASFNILNYLYYYNGGGIAVGDVDGDGLQDLYFSSNLGSNRLYRNLGNYKFEDITERAGVAGPPGWKSGVTMADVNGDGRVDIFVSAVSYLTQHGHDVLYVNDGSGRFTDRTTEFGLDYTGYSTQALFFDYDRDGDLDMYLLNHSVHSERGIGVAGRVDLKHPAADRLYRNDASRFTDVSAQAGIRDGEDGYGLGVVASDVNGDGCMDLYVANDFQGDDALYINRCDGTFTESIARATGHTSRFSMGVDAADIDDDGRTDLFVGDMLPEREDVLKTSAGAESFNLYNLRLRAGYHPQFARNTLQLNRGTAPDGTPRFSEVGYLAGVAATDWTWAPLFADLDNDGRKDLFVANGIFRRPNDLDYINFVGNEAAQVALASGDPKANQEIMRRLPQVPIPNHAFRNDGALRFTDVAEQWGLATPGFTTGAVYVDLDNDGQLDLVTNAVNGPAAIYRSRARERTGNRSLTVRLVGDGANTAGIGAKLYATVGAATQLVEQQPTRGFLSSVDPRPHFGLGRASKVDSLVVVWPDGRWQALADVPADTTITLAQKDAAGKWSAMRDASLTRPTWFADVTAGAIDFTHRENANLDTDREPLMPHLLSAEGPALAVADVNGDGLDDVFVGGAKWQPSRLFVQEKDGRFTARDDAAFAADSVDEDVDATFFDANGDGHPDLYVVTGGNEFQGEAPQLRDRLYINDGRGGMHKVDGALPPAFDNGGCVAAGDWDADGDMDLFVGARVVAGQYGVTPHSRLLRNDPSPDGSGRKFKDVTAELAPTLATAGMVSSAAWIDRDGDGRPELVVVGEWMPVRLYAFERGHFVDRSAEAGLAGTEGWWNSVTTGDLDGDGRTDLVLGNLGLNAWVKASAAEPARLYVHDFGANGVVEQILTFYRNGKSYPLAGRDDIVKLIPSLRAKYPSFRSWGASTVEDIFAGSELREATVLEARQMATSVALLGADGRFTLQPLPVQAQFAPVHAALVRDFDGDGKVDLLLGGNEYRVPPVLGRYDASHGLLLRGTGGGRFAVVDDADGGPVIEGEVRALASLRTAGGTPLVVVARNDDRLELLRPGRGAAAAPPGGRPVAAAPTMRRPGANATPRATAATR